MNNQMLAALLARLDGGFSGVPGRWNLQFGGRALYCLTDGTHDRMRVMTVVSGADGLDAAELSRCLEANFDRALDARYCLSQDRLWSAFIHPLGALTDDLFMSAVQQVVTLADNFGGSYSSGGLVFVGGS